MANAIIRNIPNTITSCNLFCGCIASYWAFQGNYKLALLFIILGAVLLTAGTLCVVTCLPSSLS